MYDNERTIFPENDPKLFSHFKKIIWKKRDGRLGESGGGGGGRGRSSKRHLGLQG